MALDKAIESGKEKRKPYKGSRSFDPACRNHGKCQACVDNRMYSTKKKIQALKDQEKE
jgi:hypothetical protein